MATPEVKIMGSEKPDLEPAVREDSQDVEADAKNHHLGIDEATDLAIGHIEEEFTIESDNSPYPEVRANVPNTDDPTLPVNTLRMWFLGCAFALVGFGLEVYARRFELNTI